MVDGDRDTEQAAPSDRSGDDPDADRETEGAAEPSLRERLAQGSHPIGGAAPPAERRPSDPGPRVDYFGDGMMSPGLARNRFVLKEYYGPEPAEDENDLGPEYTIRHHLPEILTIIGAILFVIIATL